MKKILVVLFALALCLSGCGEKKLASLVNDDIADDWSKIYAHDVGLCLSGMPTSYELVRVYE